MMKSIFKACKKETCQKAALRFFTGLFLIATTGGMTQHALKMPDDSSVFKASKNVVFNELLLKASQKNSIVYLSDDEVQENIKLSLDKVRKDTKRVIFESEEEVAKITKKAVASSLIKAAHKSGLSFEKTNELIDIYLNTPYLPQALAQNASKIGPHLQCLPGSDIYIVMLFGSVAPEQDVSLNEMKSHTSFLKYMGVTHLLADDFLRKLKTFVVFHEIGHAENFEEMGLWDKTKSRLVSSPLSKFMGNTMQNELALKGECFADKKGFDASYQVDHDPVFIKEYIYIRAMNMLVNLDHSTAPHVINMVNQYKELQVDGHMPDVPVMTPEESLKAHQGLMVTMGLHEDPDLNCGTYYGHVGDFVESVRSARIKDISLALEGHRIKDPNELAIAKLIMAANNYFEEVRKQHPEKTVEVQLRNGNQAQKLEKPQGETPTVPQRIVFTQKNGYTKG